MRKLVLLTHSNTGFGDRLIDIWAFSAFAECLNMELVTYWPKFPKHLSRAFGLSLDKRHLDRHMSFPKNITFVKNIDHALKVADAIFCFHPAGPGNLWPRNFYKLYIDRMKNMAFSDLVSTCQSRLKGKSLPEWFNPALSLNLELAHYDDFFAEAKMPDYEEYLAAVIRAAQETKPKAALQKKIDVHLKSSFVSLHLRRGDKVNENPTPWEIHHDTLLTLDKDTKGCIEAFFDGGIERIFICSDDKKAKQDYRYFSRKLQLKTLDIRSFRKLDQMLLDFFLLASSSCIIQSQKFSSFSNAASMANQIPVINMIEHHDKRSLYTRLPALDNVYFYHRLSGTKLRNLAGVA